MWCKYLAAVALSSCIATAASGAAPEFSVTIDPQNPTSCADDETIAVDSYVRIHFHGILNEDSDSPRAGTHAASDFGYTFQIGSENSIAGLNRGLDGLCKGGKVVIVVPPEMAFGDKGYGRKIPPNATIDFDIEILDVSRNELPPLNIFDMIDLNGDLVVSQEEYGKFFAQLGNLMPTSQWNEEDKNGDGVLSWDEFPLAKGDTPPLSKDEL